MQQEETHQDIELTSDQRHKPTDRTQTLKESDKTLLVQVAV